MPGQQEVEEEEVERLLLSAAVFQGAFGLPEVSLVPGYFTLLSLPVFVRVLSLFAV